MQNRILPFASPSPITPKTVKISKKPKFGFFGYLKYPDAKSDIAIRITVPDNPKNRQNLEKTEIRVFRGFGIPGCKIGYCHSNHRPRLPQKPSKSQKSRNYANFINYANFY